jgi:outer membrane immunogenic protein
MRKVFLLAAAIFALPVMTPAVAADLSLPAKEPPYPTAYQWTGFYIGPNFGYEFGRYNAIGSVTVGGVPAAGGVGVSSFTSNYNNSGIFGGGQFGFNYEFPSHLVLGFEADVEAANLNGSASGCRGGGCQSLTSNINNFGSLRLRLGYAFDNILIYGTGGGAWANTRATSTITAVPAGTLPGLAIPASSNFSTSAIGYTAGGGIEYGVLRNVTIKAEYLWTQFNGIQSTYNYGFADVAGTIPVVGNHTASLSMNTVRVGLNILLPAAPGWFR